MGDTMKKRHHFHHLWLILASYGVWFAMLSGLEEITHGKYWKIVISLLFGIVTYWLIETKIIQE